MWLTGGNMELMAADPQKKERGRPKGGPTMTIHTKIGERLGAQLRRYMESRPDGAMLRRVAERAFAMLLEAEGFWPPPDETKKGRNRPPDERGHK